MEKLTKVQWERWQLWNAVYDTFITLGEPELSFEMLSSGVTEHGKVWNYATLTQCINSSILEKVGKTRYATYRLVNMTDPCFVEAEDHAPKEILDVLNKMSSIAPQKVEEKIVATRPIDWKAKFEASEAEKSLILLERDDLRKQVVKLEAKVAKLESCKGAEQDLKILSNIIAKYL